MLKFKLKQSNKGIYQELPHNMTILQELNFGPIWVKLEDGRDALLYGADLNSWNGDGKENFYMVIDGVETTVPSNTRMVGIYERDRMEVIGQKRGDNVEVGISLGEKPYIPKLKKRQ